MMPYTDFKRTSSLQARRHSNPIACSRYTCKPSTPPPPPPISSSSLQSRYNPCVVSGLAVVPANLSRKAIKGSDRISVIPSKDSSHKRRHQICIASIDPPPLSFFPPRFLLLLLPSHIIMYQTLIPFSLSKKTPEATPLQQSHTNIIRSLSLSLKSLTLPTSSENSNFSRPPFSLFFCESPPLIIIDLRVSFTLLLISSFFHTYTKWWFLTLHFFKNPFFTAEFKRGIGNFCSVYSSHKQERLGHQKKPYHKLLPC